MNAFGPRASSPAKKVLVLGVSMLVTLVAMEGALRVRQFMRFGSGGEESLYRVDPATGLRELVPNAVVGHVRINSLGFRGPEIPTAKSADTIRLAFPGASTTFCWDVTGDELTWPHLVWARLQDAAPQTHFDYVNAGVPGYSVASSLRHFDLRVRPLRPNVVVIYHATNDLAYATYDLARARGLLTTRPDVASGLSRYSLFWFLLEKNLNLLARQQQPDDDRRKLHVDVRELSRPFERRLTELVRASQAVADVVAVATFSVKMRQTQPPADQARFAAMSLYYMPNMTLPDLYAAYAEYNRVIVEVARQTGALLIDDEMSIPGDDRHFVDSFHFADAGSRAMAERVTRRLLTSSAFRAVVQGNENARSALSEMSGGRS